MSRKDICDLYHIDQNNINCCDENGWTALHHASSKGSLEDVRYLLHSGARANIKNLNGETPLILAVEREHTAISRLLIRYGTHLIYDEDDCSWTVLHQASYAGLEVEIIQSLVARRTSIINSKTSSGKTALMLAAGNSHIQVAECLIRSGADVNCTDNEGWTALHYAADTGRIEMVWSLIHFGADVSVKNAKRQTPEILAYRGRHKKTGNMLSDCAGCRHDTDVKQRLNIMLLHASCAGLTTHVQSLINEGADINCKGDFSCERPLLMAAERHRKDVVELLIDLGADIALCNYDGCTVLHLAAKHGWAEIVQCLVTKGADFESRCRVGKTPLIIAIQNSRKKVVELLVNLGANIKVCGEYGWTLLHYAAKTDVAMVRFLVNIGIDFDSVSLRGETPLLIAAQASNRYIVELLMELGANISCNWKSTTLLHYASSNGWFEIVQTLVRKGLDLNCRMSDGSTPLIVALNKDNFEMAHYLLKEGADCTLKNNSRQSAFNVLLQWSKVREEDERKPEKIKMMKALIKYGAYVDYSANESLVSKLLTQVYILKNVKLCAQIIINNFNNKDLPQFYRVFTFANRLPKVEKLKINECSDLALQAEQDVIRDIKVRGYCNVLKVRSLVLRILAIRSLLKYPPSIKKCCKSH